MRDHMSAEEFREMHSRKPAKYRNKKTTIDGITFDSRMEAQRYVELKLQLESGIISGFGVQPSFVLPGGVRYRADFIVSDGATVWVEDVKGVETQAFKIKRKLWQRVYGSWLPLKLIKRGDLR